MRRTLLGISGFATLVGSCSPISQPLFYGFKPPAAYHQIKIKILMEFDDDLNNYFRSTDDISQVFLSRQLEIRKYTPAATKQLNLIESDIGRSIYHISNNLRYNHLIEDIRHVIVNSNTIEKEVQDKYGCWYQMRIMPYITQDERIDGAIVIFVGINELKNLQLLHSSVLDSSLNTIQAFKAVHNTQGQIVDLEWTMLNARAQSFLERGEQQLLGKHFRREFPSLVRPELFEKYVQVITTGEPLKIEDQQDFKGLIYWFNLIAIKMGDGLVLTAEDITDRKNADAQLRKQAAQIRESAERLQQVFEAFPQITWTSLADGSTNSYNQFWFKYTGLTFEETQHGGWVMAIHPEEAADTLAAYQEGLEKGIVFQREVRIRRHDGEYRWHINQTFPFHNHEGNIILWVSSATDIHEQKLAIQNLRESRHFIRQVAETSPDFIYVYDLEKQQEIYYNHELTRLLEYNTEAPVEKDRFALFGLVHPEDYARLDASLNHPAPAKPGQIRETDYRLRNGQGNFRWFRNRSAVFKSHPDGSPCQVMGIAQEVTELIEFQQRLRAERDFTESLLDNSVDGIVAFDTNASITSWNVMMEVLNGKLKEEVLGKNIFDMFPEYHINDEGQAVQAALRGEKTVLHDHPYGLREGYYETSTIPLFGEEGQVTGGLSIIHDITERKRLEDERINLKLHQQKEILSAILKTQEAERKRISEALHNGLGQLLYAVKLKVNDMLPTKPRNKELQAAIDLLLDDAIKETRQLSFELMPSVLKDFGLEAAIGEICKRIASSKIALHCEVIGLKDRLNPELEIAVFRICQELLNNILKHSKATEASIQVLNQKSKLVLRVEDNGIGFDPAKRDQTGLGLGSIKSRLELMEGAMDIDSEPGAGTRFIIKINKKKLK